MNRVLCTAYKTEWNTTEPKPWLVYDPCDMELFNVVSFGFAIYVNMLICIYVKCISTSDLSPRCFFRHHSSRCAINTIGLLVEFALFADYALSSCGSMVVAAVGVLAQLSSGLVCYLLEIKGQTGPLGCGVLVWLICGLSRALLFVSLMDVGLSLNVHVRPIALAISAICCYTTAGLHLFTMVRKPKMTEAEFNLEFYTYKHDLSSWYSRVTFYWLTSFLRNCYKNPIQLDDLGQLPIREQSTTQYERLYNVYLREKELYGTSSKVSMWKCYCKVYWKEFLIGGILKMFGDFVGYIGPLGVSIIVNFVARKQNTTKLETEETLLNIYSCCVTHWDFLNNGYVMAFIMLISCIAQGSFSQASTHILNVEGIRLKSGLQAMLYYKMLKLQQTQVDATSENGHIINLMSEDTMNIMSSFWIGHYIWAIPLKIFFLIYLLFLKLGWSAIIGSTCCILIMIPLQFVIGKKMSANSKKIATLSDKRLQLTNEVLQGIRLVKLCGWENDFVDRISEARNNELNLLDKDSLYWGSMTFLTHASSVLITLFCLGLYYLQNGTQLDSGAVFSSLALSNQLTVPLFIFPITVPIIIAAIVSTRRVEKFMALPEIIPSTNNLKTHISKNYKQNHMTNVLWSVSDVTFQNNKVKKKIEENIKNKQETEIDNCITIRDASFSWPNSKVPSLIVDYLNIEEGKLTIVTGKVGSGKTSLLQALLGEMNCLFGEVDFKKGYNIAYVSQKTWLLNASVVENIVFGDKYNKSRFKRVIEACALGPDIDILPDKEMTMIGERGIALSGGQQQRVTIARALYSKANIILMDNPLSALDSEVSQHVMFNGIKKSTLNQTKTVIMTTSFANDLSYADTVVLMDSGKVNFFGNLADLETRGVHHMITSMENQEHTRRTASERWKLFKLVSKIGNQLYRNWPPNQHKKLKSKKNFGALYGSRYLTHDLLLPTDECGDTDSIVERNHWLSSNKKRERSATIADIQLPRRNPFIDESLVNQPAVSFHSSIKYRNYPNEKHPQRSLRRHILSSLGNSHENNRFSRLLQYSIKRKTRTDGEIKLPEEFLLKKTTLSISDISNEEISELKYDRGRLKDEFIYNSVSMKTYLKYISWSGWTTYIFYIILTVAWQTSRVFVDYWLSCWTYIEFSHEIQAFWYLTGYSFLCFISIILSALSNTLGQYGALKARKLIHQRMLSNIILSPLSFFDATPIGRIDNCFSNDLIIIDKKIGTSMQRLVHFVFLCLCGVVVNAIITPWFLIIVVPICLVYYTVQKFYRCSSKDLQKLESNLRSPMVVHCNESISGLETIRAFDKQAWFMSEMINRIDNHTKVFLIISSSNRWLGIALDYLGGVIVFVATMVALITTTLFSSSISSAMVGLAINYTLLVPVYLNWVVKFFADLETYMSAVERTEEFATIPSENYRKEAVITRAWPSKGSIILDNVSVKYDENQEHVISNVSLHIPPGQKVGICGRTGSGKSSLVMSILNMVPIRDGIITIDDIDINNVPLQTLRSRISVIPQDVRMFSGTIRQNLDLKNEFSDNEIWSCLRMTQMEDTVLLQLGGLDGLIGSSGDNLSSGQKQLLCLARAILQDNVCLIMDEPTSSIDDETEKKLLEAIKNSFQGRTVITIAHRLSTILDYDRVLILEAGKIIEDTIPSTVKTIPEII
ncbi:ATP-binding cassette sub-family C member Sur-like isoform X2 [Daktulosphaira vitifoliae]|uniref:ATP-binding cassette sub-family C member Sur-like isoform X2 n=1 Tax=Daktulosphaira vitifoliae TaxID=58002 RepID=UPI0021AAA679|nr:ATP-binding cassette sub-family C member Sur-like isoform X2 [Daktulosphaira vitifoliae]